MDGLERGQHAVPHREQGGGRAAGRADLGVDAFDVVAGRLRSDVQLPSDLPRRGPARHEHQHLDLARGQSGRRRRQARATMSGGAQDHVHGRAVEPPLADLGAQVRGGLLRGDRRPVRSVLQQRVVDVGGRQVPAEQRDVGAADRAVVPRAVQPLVVRRRDRRQAGERRRAAEHPFGEVRMEPDALAVALAERPGPVPDRVRDRRAPQVVEQPRPPRRDDVLLGHARRPSPPPTPDRRPRGNGRRTTATSGRPRRP